AYRSFLCHTVNLSLWSQAGSTYRIYLRPSPILRPLICSVRRFAAGDLVPLSHEQGARIGARSCVVRSLGSSQSHRIHT
ncbi:hypothetical protein PLICRDRAFT_94112, partial [Plicaturopsis crispa FD-325 SS-3]